MSYIVRRNTVYHLAERNGNNKIQEGIILEIMRAIKIIIVITYVRRRNICLYRIQQATCIIQVPKSSNYMYNSFL